MFCIICRSKTQVVNSRLQKKLNQTWRRRKCLSCGTIFTAIEKIDLESTYTFVGLNDTETPFRRDRLYASVLQALGHRQNAPEEATALTETIIGKLLQRSSSGRIDRAAVVQQATETLRAFDRAASISYAAYHTI